MTYNKILIVQNILFIGVAICSRKTDSSTFRNEITTSNGTTERNLFTINSKDKVELKMYYETLCPASVDFFVEQLKPAVKRLGSHLDVHLIPYGHAKTFRSHGRYSFRCQHGPPECYGNMVHACALDVLGNKTHAILFNGCLMQYTSYHFNYNYFVSVLSWCGYAENVHIYDIWECVNGRRGSILLKEYGDETHALSPSYVPYLILDGSTEHQDQASGNLFATVCQMLVHKPQVCLSQNK